MIKYKKTLLLSKTFFANFARTFASFAVRLFLLFTFLSIYRPAFSQEPEISETILDLAEELTADEDNPWLSELFIQELYELSENPVNINSGDENEIARIFFLSDFQVKSLADHVTTSGNILSVYEIALIPGFDRQTAEWISRFISLENNNPLFINKSGFSNSLLNNIIIKPGEYNSTYLGSPVRILTRYKFRTGNFSGGFTAEKDPGEKFLTGKPPLPDFFSAHLAYNGTGIIRKVIAGDFGACFGLGTNINTSMHMALSLNSPGFMPVRNEIKPWTSTEENKFMRGCVADLSYKNLDLILFYSVNNIDAATAVNPDSSQVYVTSLCNSGIHNRSDLLGEKDALINTVWGVNLTCNLKSFKAGISWSHTGFSLPFIATYNDPKKLYSFSGSSDNVLSFHYNYLMNRLLLFGEVSRCLSEAFALIQGISIRPSDRFSVGFLYRNYSPGFISFHGNGPGISGSTSNEKGLMGNLSFELAKHLFAVAGCDIVNIPWLKYGTSFPSVSKRYLFRLRYVPDDKYSFDLSYNFRSANSDLAREQGMSRVSENTSALFKGVARLMFSERLTLIIRSDYKLADPSGSKGMLLLQDIDYKFRKIPLSIWARYCIFRTDNWDSRLYTYENDLLYSFSIPALSGNGTRSYVMIKWDFGKFAELRFKYSLTEKISVRSTEPVQDLKLQFRIWF